MAKDYVELLVVTKGHPYDHGAFHAMLDSLHRVACTHVEQPAAQVVLRPENDPPYDAVLFYDMSGIVMPGPRGLEGRGEMGDFEDPPDDYRRSIEALLARGTGIVMMNHGLISWPSWPLWREISGTSFMLRAGKCGGHSLPGSGYRGGMGQPDRNATHRLRPATPGHPVLAALETGVGDDSEPGFEICDELYLKSSCFEDDVLPLLRSDFEFAAEHFSPPPLAPPEEQAAWTHPEGSNLIVWANGVGRSPVVASEIGDGPQAYASPGLRRLLENAVQWVASPEARAWAERWSADRDRRAE